MILVAAVATHVVFSAQALIAARHGGLILNEAFMVIFYPHTILMFFLPPTDPFGLGTQVDWLRLIGKLADAIPASLLYGYIYSAIWSAFRKKMLNQSPEPVLSSGTSPAKQEPRLP